MSKNPGKNPEKRPATRPSSPRKHPGGGEITTLHRLQDLARQYEEGRRVAQQPTSPKEP